MYRFNQDMTVFEVCKQIREKTAGLEGSGADHGLFQPGDGVRMGRWLRPERTLMFYVRMRAVTAASGRRG